MKWLICIFLLFLLFFIFREKNKLTEERYKRSLAEEGEAKAILQVQIYRMEMEKLKKQCEEAELKLALAASTTSTLDERLVICEKLEI